jgi:hypothetical protein
MNDHDRYVAACNWPGLLDEDAVQAHLHAYLRVLGMDHRIERLRAGWTLAQQAPLRRYAQTVLALLDEDEIMLAQARAHPEHKRPMVLAMMRALFDDEGVYVACKSAQRRYAAGAVATLTGLDVSDARDARAVRAAFDATAMTVSNVICNARACMRPYLVSEARVVEQAGAEALRGFVAWCIQHYRAAPETFDLSWLAALSFGAPSDFMRAWSAALFEAYLAGAWLLHWTDEVLYWVAKPVVHTRFNEEEGVLRVHNEHGPAIESAVEPLYFLDGIHVSPGTIGAAAQHNEQ